MLRSEGMGNHRGGDKHHACIVGNRTRVRQRGFGIRCVKKWRLTHGLDDVRQRPLQLAAQASSLHKLVVDVVANREALVASRALELPHAHLAMLIRLRPGRPAGRLRSHIAASSLTLCRRLGSASISAEGSGPDVPEKGAGLPQVP